LPGEPAGGSAAAGEVGQYISGANVGGADVPAFNFTATASSPVLNATAHGLYPYAAIAFATTGALPAPLAAATTYYVLGGAALTANTFQVATTIANALAGTAISMTSAGSGTNSTTYGPLASGVAKDVLALLLPAGDWELNGSNQFIAGSGASMTFMGLWFSKVSATFSTAALPGNAGGYVSYNGAAQVNYNSAIPTLTARFSLPVQAPIYLSAFMNFSGGIYQFYGAARARRAR
jgi:hypothetical protein